MTKLTDFQRKISQLLENSELRMWEPMSRHTSFKIGGAVEVMAFPTSPEELQKMLKVSEYLDCEPVILGAGTNVLAPDEGINGLVICLKDCMDGMRQLDGNRIWVASGVTMSRAAIFAAGLGLGGLEFAHGIPGTVGGGVYMNAGAYGGEISQVCESVDILWANGEVETVPCTQMGFSYRHSRLEEEKGIVLSVVFALEPKEESQIRAQIRTLLEKRKASQPLDLPSAGSAFKRPVGGYAAALIDEAGLKGYRVGDAGVSEKHAGFVVNLGSATASDVKQLLADVSQKVFERSGIRLEPEMRIW